MRNAKNRGSFQLQVGRLAVRGMMLRGLKPDHPDKGEKSGQAARAKKSARLWRLRTWGLGFRV